MVRSPRDISNRCCFLGVFESSAMTDDFFRNRLDQMIDLRHPLAVLANRMPWQEIKACLARRWARQAKTGKEIEDLDLFGPVTALARAVASNSNAGRPCVPTRLMVALLYLKHAFNESDEEVSSAGARRPPGSTFREAIISSTAGLVTRRNSGAFASCWEKMALKSCWRAPWKWPSRSSSLPRRNWPA